MLSVTLFVVLLSIAFLLLRRVSHFLIPTECHIIYHYTECHIAHCHAYHYIFIVMLSATLVIVKVIKNVTIKIRHTK